MTLSPNFSIKFLCLSGNTTATNRSRLIATICNTEVAQERYVKMKYARDRLALQSVVQECSLDDKFHKEWLTYQSDD